MANREFTPRQRYDILHVALRGICRAWDPDDEQLVIAFERMLLCLDRLASEVWGSSQREYPHVVSLKEWQRERDDATKGGAK